MQVIFTAEKYRLYSKARADKPAATSVPPKPVPVQAAAQAPVTPSKRTARHEQQQEDFFKTPSRSSAPRANGHVANDAAASPTANSGTRFAYAPSPSRLRALAASRSFSGSPNKKGGLAGQEAANYSSSNTGAPVNLGRSFVLPPTVDTPRTKAKRWLAGDAVSPPVKLRYNASQAGTSKAPQASTSTSEAPQKRTNGSKPDFWRQMEQRRSATPAEDIDIELGEASKQVDSSMLRDEPMNGHMEDADFLAPSPVKPAAMKPNGKGKQRQRIDLFGESAPSDEMSTVVNSKANPRIPTNKVTATPITSFFSAKPPLTRPPATNGEQEKQPYIPGQSKAKKRTIAATAIIPSISEDFDKIEESDIAPIQTATVSSRSTKKVDKQKTKVAKTEAQEQNAGPSDRTKRLRKEPLPANDDENDMQEDDPDPYKDAYDPKVLEALEAQNGDYDTRDLSDEYDEYKPRRRSMTPAMHSQNTRESSTAPLDESLDPDMVSLLSLKASPVKNRLARLHKKREDTYRKLLLEPTYIMETKRRITGLEDLEEEEERKRQAELEEAGTDPSWNSELPDEDPTNVLGGGHEEQSDDDWASEPEGWKDLSDGEMPNDSF